MSKMTGDSPPSHPASRTGRMQSPHSSPARPASASARADVGEIAGDQPTTPTAPDNDASFVPVPPQGYAMEGSVPEQAIDTAGSPARQVLTSKEVKLGQILFDAIDQPHKLNGPPKSGASKRKASLSDDEENFLDPALRTTKKRARLHDTAQDVEELAGFVPSSDWSSNDLAGFTYEGLGVGAYDNLVPPDSEPFTGFQNRQAPEAYNHLGQGAIPAVQLHAHGNTTPYFPGNISSVQPLDAIGGSMLSPQYQRNQIFDAGSNHGTFINLTPQHFVEFSEAAQADAIQLQEQAAQAPPSFPHQQQVSVPSQPTAINQPNMNSNRKQRHNAPNTGTGRVSRPQMNTTRLREDARPPMGVTITAKEIAVFNQKWMVSPDLVTRLQRNKVTMAMMSDFHLDAIGQADDERKQTTLKNKMKKEFSQGGKLFLDIDKWAVKEATKFGPDNVLKADNWRFRDYYRHRNRNTTDQPKQQWKDYPLHLFYSHIPKDKRPTGRDRGIMTRVFEFCEEHGFTGATTADWDLIIRSLPNEPVIAPIDPSKNLDEEAVTAFYG